MNEEKKLDRLIMMTRRAAFGNLVCYIIQEMTCSQKNLNEIRGEAFEWIEKILPMEES